MPKTEAQKKAQKKWNEMNADYVRQLANINQKAYYLRKREERLEYAREYREKKKQEKQNANKENIPVN